MLASAWLEDIIKFQAHKFLAGIAPIRSLCKVSSAAMQLIAIPVEHLFAESSGELGDCCTAGVCFAKGFELTAGPWLVSNGPSIAQCSKVL